MANAIVIAKIFAPIFLIFGLSMIIHANRYKKLIAEMPKNLLLTFVTASFKLLFGIIILVFYSSWNFSWALIITIMGRLIVINTGIYILYPKFLNNIMKFYNKSSFLVSLGFFVLFLGLIFLYYGFLK